MISAWVDLHSGNSFLFLGLAVECSCGRLQVHAMGRAVAILQDQARSDIQFRHTDIKHLHMYEPFRIELVVLLLTSWSLLGCNQGSRDLYVLKKRQQTQIATGSQDIWSLDADCRNIKFQAYKRLWSLSTWPLSSFLASEQPCQSDIDSIILNPQRIGLNNTSLRFLLDSLCKQHDAIDTMLRYIIYSNNNVSDPADQVQTFQSVAKNIRIRISIFLIGHVRYWTKIIQVHISEWSDRSDRSGVWAMLAFVGLTGPVGPVGPGAAAGSRGSRGSRREAPSLSTARRAGPEKRGARRYPTVPQNLMAQTDSISPHLPNSNKNFGQYLDHPGFCFSRISFFFLDNSNLSIYIHLHLFSGPLWVPGPARCPRWRGWRGAQDEGRRSKKETEKNKMNQA